MGWEDSEINSPDADNKSDVIFKSSQIKEGDHSDFFVNVQGDEARKRAEKRQQEAHDRSLEKHRKQFQNDLKNKEKAIIRAEKRAERKEKLLAFSEWLGRHRKKLIFCVLVLLVGASSYIAGPRINMLLRPTLTDGQIAAKNFDDNAELVAESIYEIFDKYDVDSDDPSQLDNIYNEADRFIEDIEEDKKFSAYIYYGIFTLARGDFEKTKAIIDELDKFDRSDMENYSYYSLLSSYYSSINDYKTALEYANKANEYNPEEYTE